LYFAIENKKQNQKTFVYVFAIPNDEIRYYDSDTATILANLAKLPLKNEGRKIYGDKSKTWLVQNAKNIIKGRKTARQYNEKYFGFLFHEIQSDKSYMQPLINLGDIFSVQCVKTKLNNDRIFMQKGAFLLFGLNINCVEKAIPLDGSYDKPKYWKDKKYIKWVGTPIKKIVKIRIGDGISLDNLKRLGISKPYIYPNMEKVGQYFVDEFKKSSQPIGGST
jgi:hypothetical protein